MKKFYILLSASFAIFALASCQRVNDIEKPVEQEGSIPFELVANVTSPSSESKTTLNTSTWAVNWEDGDKIYAVTTDEAWGEAYPSDNDAAEFTYSSATEKFSTSKAIADGSHTFNFLYTNGTQKSYHRGGSTTFQLYTNQSYDVSNPVANIKAYDALAGQVTATTPTSFVDVDMSHLFTLMKVTIKNKTGASLTATKLEIEAEGAYLYGIFNVTFGATCSASYSKSGGSKIAVNIANGSIANNATIDVYLVMAPLTSYTGDITFTVTDSSDNTYSRKNTISSPLTLAAGTYNTATHTLETPDDAAAHTLVFTSSTMQTNINDYTSSWSTVCAGFAWTIENFNNNNRSWTYVKCGRKSYDSVGTITTDTAMTEAISKVTLTIDAITAANVNSIKLYVATNSTFTSGLQTITGSLSSGAQDFDIPSPTANCYYKLEFDCKAKSNGCVTVSKVQYYE